MSRVTVMLDDAKLNRFELQELIAESTKRLKAIRPFTLRKTYRRCGKPECMCSEQYGSHLHGPYLYILFTTNNGEQVQKSLGRLYSEEDIQEMCERPRPRWYDRKYILNNRQLGKVGSEVRYQKGWWQYDLSPETFEAVHECKMEDDKFGRPRKIWVNYRQYETDAAKWDEVQNVCAAEWSNYGVGTIKGVKILDQLVADGYYLAE